MSNPVHLGVDLGAGGGRVLVGGFAQGAFLEEVYRFAYPPRHEAGHLRWDFDQLLEGLSEGLRLGAGLAAARGMVVRSIGVDSWGVDYGLVDDRGTLVEHPICYRDSRTDGVMARAFAHVPRETLFRETGIQFLPFNTVFQLMAHVEEGLPTRAARLLMIPDLCHHALCGSATGEHTNASTTQLLRVDAPAWDERLCADLAIPVHLLPELRPAGADLGPLRDDLRRRWALPAATVVQPATHDTASAVAGTPLAPGWAYISSGTWSLVGLERPRPLLDAAALAANVTSERGVRGTFRLLKNVAGLWILECCRRQWQARGLDASLSRVLPDAGDAQTVGALILPDAPMFFNPSSMLDELARALRDTGQQAPATPRATAKVVLDSLACRYATVVDTLERLTGEHIPGIHVVGGGARNEYLNQATANATARPVTAGPAEATAFGNILVQAVACGITTFDEGRHRIAEAFPARRYEPRDAAAWAAAVRHYRHLEGEAAPAAAINEPSA